MYVAAMLQHSHTNRQLALVGRPAGGLISPILDRMRLDRHAPSHWPVSKPDPPYSPCVPDAEVHTTSPNLKLMPRVANAHVLGRRRPSPSTSRFVPRDQPPLPLALCDPIRQHTIYESLCCRLGCALLVMVVGWVGLGGSAILGLFVCLFRPAPRVMLTLGRGARAQALCLLFVGLEVWGARYCT